MVASAVLTGQMRCLPDQIRDYNRKVTNLPSQTIGSSIADRTNWYTTVQDISLGSAALGLTWSAVVAMFIANVMWNYA